MSDFNKDALIDAAMAGRSLAYAPYSKFKVGAAILTKQGKYFTGCNIENASYPLGNCAERTAMFKMISEGFTKEDVVAMCIVGQGDTPISPCGACRQVMSELLKPTTPIILTNLKREVMETTVEALLPYSFSLEENKK